MIRPIVTAPTRYSLAVETERGDLIGILEVLHNPAEYGDTVLVIARLELELADVKLEVRRA